MHAPLANLLTVDAEVVRDAVTNAAEVAKEAPSNLFVVLMGLCTVFLGLICIILIIELMTAVTRKLGTSEQSAKATAAAPAPMAPVSAPAVNAPIENRAEIVAAVCAAVAEELGTDVSALRVVSFKKV